MAAFSSTFRHHTSRADQFRQRYRAGDTLGGELVAYIGPDRAWVRIDDLALVAAIRPGREPGTNLLFTVQSLHPDIVLKEHVSSDIELRDTLLRFVAARQHFEARMVTETGTNWAKKLRWVLDATTSHPRELLAVRLHLLTLNKHLDSGQRVAYCPWLLPGLRESVLILTQALPGTTIGEVLGHGLLPSSEQVWIQTLHTLRQSRTRCFAPKSVLPPQWPQHIEVAEPRLFPLHTPWERLFGPPAKRHYQTTI